MNHKIQTAEMKQARWPAHNSHTCVDVCMHEIKVYLGRNGCLYLMCVYVLYFTVYMIYVRAHRIQSICVSSCTALRALMM